MPAESNPFVAQSVESGHFVKIYTKYVENPEDIEGEPIEKIYISAQKPTANSNYDGPLKDHHKAEFPEAWARWQARENPEEVGTSLDFLPGIPKNVVEEYNNRGVFTIEAFAKLDAESLKGFPMGRKFHQAAEHYLDFTNPAAQKRLQEKMSEEVEEKVIAKLLDNPEAIKALAEKAGVELGK